jgi:hypothetical protein
MPALARPLYGIPFNFFKRSETTIIDYAYAAMISDCAIFISVTPHKILLIWETILNHWVDFIKMVTIDKSIKSERKKYLLSLKQPPKLMEEIWPLLKVVCTWTKSICAPKMGELKNIYKGIVFENFYATTEGQLGLMLHEYPELDGNVLNLNQQLLEFIPLDDENKILNPFEIKKGEKYYILITNRMGLRRYFLGDIIECTGFFNNLPVIRFVQKSSQIIILGHTRISEELLIKTMSEILFQGNFLIAPNAHYNGLIIYCEQKPQEKFINEFEKYLGEKLIDFKEDRDSELILKTEIKVCDYSFFNKNTHFQSKSQLIKTTALN